ncbi:hypothetical protein [Streptomyces sp. NPDC005435]|uniref:hypothetical protein n=1 Tax=Streptomyces sp. NPDC005435 TaxID=3154464 RepID=UPI0034555BD9
MSDEVTLFTLPRGATGFRDRHDDPLPETDRSAFRTALHAAARAGGARVREVTEQRYPRNYHSATVTDRAGEWTVLCHLHHPWIAFADELRDVGVSGFVAPPGWTAAFSDAGFTVLGAGLLMSPLSTVDTSALTAFDRDEIRHHRAGTVGDVLFNSWD